jgi:hypothetical protein
MDKRPRKILSITPAAASFATPYSSGDVIGGTNTITAAVLDPKGVSRLESVVVLDKANQKAALDLVFFNAAPAASFGADNAAYGLNDSDLDKCIGRISVATGDYASSGTNNAEATLKNIGLILDAIAGSTSVYMVVVARGAVTYGSATDLIIKLGLEQ